MSASDRLTMLAVPAALTAFASVAAFSRAVTTTNRLTGLAVLATRHPRRRALQIAVNSLCVVVVAWTVQRGVFPTADFSPGSGLQRRFILPRGSRASGRGTGSVRAFDRHAPYRHGAGAEVAK